MAFVGNANALRYVFHLERNSDSWVNVFHTRLVGPHTAAQLDTQAEFAYNIYANSLLPPLAAITELVAVDCYSMASPEAPVGHYVAATPETGTGSGEVLPLQSAAVLTWRTGGRGRSARGRSYISGWSEGAASDNALIPGAAASILAAGQAFLAAWLAAEEPLVIYSTQSGGVDRPVASLFDVTACELRTAIFGSQRERNRRESSA